jgi:hypothetical protein
MPGDGFYIDPDAADQGDKPFKTGEMTFATSARSFSPNGRSGQVDANGEIECAESTSESSPWHLLFRLF